MQYTEKELTKLLADVEKEFTSHLVKAEENFRLAKSENESSAPGDDEEKKPVEAKEKKKDKEEPKSDAPPSKEKAAAPAAAESEDEEEEQEEEVAADEAAIEDPAAEGDASGYDAEDLAHLAEMYASMSRDELMAHHDAVKEALDAMSAQEAPAPDAPEAQAPIAEEAEAPIDEPAPEMAFAKSESIKVDLVKSELIAKNEALTKELAAVSEFITKLVSKKAAPAAKAITSIETIVKSEANIEVKPLSKGEITAILNRKASDSKLSKSDREAINAYYGTGQVGIEKITHLLK